MITGARLGTLTGFRRLIASAMSHDLNVFLVPGPDIARAQGLDIESSGLQPVASPRHANVLLVMGPVTPALQEATAVIYAQMVRPRSLFVLGAQDLSSLPAADVEAELSQQGLIEGVNRLRRVFSESAFRPSISDFDVPILQIRIEYTCSMHPEIVQDEPGSCPRCGMFLIPREVQSMAEHRHMNHQKINTDAEIPVTFTHNHGDHQHDASMEYTCPMHPDVVQNEPGSCPRCGMNLEPRESQTESDHDHHHMDHADQGNMNMDHDDMGFMSMIDVTKDLPRSEDGLPMEWIDAPFGPFFPGLPGGLLLLLTLDGDAVARSETHCLSENTELVQSPSMEPPNFIERLTCVNPLSPIAYRLLACRALEHAAGIDISAETARARIGALERERIASHLGWLALFAQQTGFDWLMRRAASLQLKFLTAEFQQIKVLKPSVLALIKRLQQTPLLKSRTANIGQLMADIVSYGPVARAAGIDNDARNDDKICVALGFTAVKQIRNDVLARLQVRLDEITHSLMLIEAADAVVVPVSNTVGKISSSGEARVETPRGMAHLQLTLENGQVMTAQLDAPSTYHLNLINPMIDQQELGDALMAVNSLDLSPWEVLQ